MQLQLAQAEARAQQLEAKAALASDRESALEKRASTAETQLADVRSKNAGLLAKVSSLEQLKANDTSADAQDSLRRMHSQQVFSDWSCSRLMRVTSVVGLCWHATQVQELEQQHEAAIKKLHSKCQAREEEMEQEAASAKSDAVARVKRGVCSISILVCRCAAASSGLSSFEANLTEMQAQVDTAKSEAAGLRSEVARLQAQVDAAREAALTQHQDSLRSEVDHLKKVFKPCVDSPAHLQGLVDLFIRIRPEWRCLLPGARARQGVGRGAAPRGGCCAQDSLRDTHRGCPRTAHPEQIPRSVPTASFSNPLALYA